MFKRKGSKFLSKKVDKITNLFTKTINQLQEKAIEADEIRTKTLEKIELMEKECDNLKEVRDRAYEIANKISNITE